MSFRRRIVLLAAAAVAAAVAIASVTTYVVVRDQLRDQVDDGLRQLGTTVAAISERAVRLQSATGFPVPGAGVPFRLPIDPLTGPTGSAQIVQADGDVFRPQIGDSAAPSLPVDERTRAVAAGAHPPFFTDTEVDGTHVRMYTTLARGGALQLVRPLTEVDDTLGRLRWILLLVTIGGVGGAAGLGLVVARSALRPVQELTDAAEHVARTQDLQATIPAAGEPDELGRLGASFTTMLRALDASRDAQRRLVADASHELRTPLTSVRTNVELLAREPALAAEDREQLLSSATAQLEELSVLVGDLVDLARPGGPQPAEPGTREPLRLDELVEEVVARARTLVPDCRFDVVAQVCLVEGVRPQLHRAIANLLDNAVKHGPPAGPVEVTVTDGELVVRDHGPGIAPEDRAHVFDRFYRAPQARGLPGSGLGLAIVRQAAEEHGGSVEALPAPGGGTRLVLRLPVVHD